MERSTDLSKQAAVLVVLASGEKGECVLLTRRAQHLKQHAGEVAFPGGKWEPGDANLLQTALRETQEEVGIAPESVSVMGELTPVYTRNGVRVTPYLGRVEADIQLTANPDELDEMFWVPVDFLKEDERVRTDTYRYLSKLYWAPAYQFGAHLIWGFTSRVLVELLKVQFDTELQAPEGAC